MNKLKHEMPYSKQSGSNEEVQINIFSDDFSPGDLSKWTEHSPYDETDVVNINDENALCVSGRGKTGYHFTYTDGKYNLDTYSILRLKCQFLLESAPAIIISAPNGPSIGNTMLLKTDKSVDAGSWYALSFAVMCQPSSDLDQLYHLSIPGNGFYYYKSKS